MSKKQSFGQHMSRSPSPVGLNFTPQALFPNIPNASLDRKCVVIAKVVKDLVMNILDNGIEIQQQQVLDDARQKYTFLNGERILSISEACQRVSGFVSKGVELETAKLYFEHLVRPECAEEWRNLEMVLV